MKIDFISAADKLKIRAEYLTPFSDSKGFVDIFQVMDFFARQKWEPGKYEISLNNKFVKSKTVKGIIYGSGLIGIHKSNEGPRVLTHIPSGSKIVSTLLGEERLKSYGVEALRYLPMNGSIPNKEELKALRKLSDRFKKELKEAKK